MGFSSVPFMCLCVCWLVGMLLSSPVHFLQFAFDIEKHFGISIMSLFAKGGIRFANAAHTSAQCWVIHMDEIIREMLLDNPHSNNRISILFCISRTQTHKNFKHTIRPLIRQILFLNIPCNPTWTQFRVSYQSEYVRMQLRTNSLSFLGDWNERRR